MALQKASDLLLLTFTASFFVTTWSLDSVNLCAGPEVNYENYTESKTDSCDCEQRYSCVRKCCQSGFHHFHDERPHHGYSISICIRKNTTNFTVPIYDGLSEVHREDKFIVGMLDCQNDHYQYFKLNRDDPRQRVFIQRNRSLYYPFYNKLYRNDRYCVDEQNGMTVFLCFWPKKATARTVPKDFARRRIIHTIAKLVPLPFLLVTFIVYAILPESSLHGKALMCHVLSLIFGNSCVAIANYYIIQKFILCQVLGYFIIFFMISSFFWMNVMCIDIWLAFSGLREHFHLKRKLFLLCSIYACGIPLLLILTIFLINNYGNTKSVIYPRVGSNACFVNGDLQVFIYYFGPILILVIINTILFILTVINIQKVKKETSMLQRADSKRHMSSMDDRKKVSLYWKLLFAMGINPVINIHVIQALSWSVGCKLKADDTEYAYIYYLKDLAHNLYAIFIFITYVCNKKTWENLRKRYLTIIGRPILANSPRPVAISISEDCNGQIPDDPKNSREELYTMNNL